MSNDNLKKALDILHPAISKSLEEVGMSPTISAAGHLAAQAFLYENSGKTDEELLKSKQVFLMAMGMAYDNMQKSIREFIANHPDESSSPSELN